MAKKKIKNNLDLEEIEEEGTSTKMTQGAKLGDSYVSMALGAIVIVAIAAVFFVFLRGNFTNNTIPVDESMEVTQTETETYTLAEGEGLWDVAVKFYGDGNRWVEIAEVNNLTDNPDNVPPGTELIIPNLE